MNFEIAPRNNWLIDVPYDQGLMYCLFLEVDGTKGWRMPTTKEADILVGIVDPTEDEHKIVIPTHLEEFREYWFDMDSFGFWTFEDNAYGEIDDDDHQFTVIPVRDIKQSLQINSSLL